jgi:hypothetical protein
MEDSETLRKRLREKGKTAKLKPEKQEVTPESERSAVGLDRGSKRVEGKGQNGKPKRPSTLGIATVLSFAVCPSTFVPEFFLRPSGKLPHLLECIARCVNRLILRRACGGPPEIFF